MSKQSVKTTIDANIKQNGNQEITGQILNSVLNEMVDNLAEEASTTEKLSKLENETKAMWEINALPASSPSTGYFPVANAGARYQTSAYTWYRYYPSDPSVKYVRVYVATRDEAYVIAFHSGTTQTADTFIGGVASARTEGAWFEAEIPQGCTRVSVVNYPQYVPATDMVVQFLTDAKTIVGEVDGIATRVDAVENMALYPATHQPLQVLCGRDGYIADGIFHSSVNFKCSDFVAVHKGDKLTLYNLVGAGHAYLAFYTLANYESYDALNSVLNGESTYAWKLTEWSAPSDGYVIISARTEEMTTSYIGYDVYDAQPSFDTSISAVNGGKTALRGKLGNLVEKKTDVGATASGKCFSLLHFSDVHTDAVNLARIGNFIAEYGDYIDDAICTGDITSPKFESGFGFWQRKGLERVLIALGNHDVQTTTTYADNTYSAVKPSMLIVSKKRSYDRYFAPYISLWGVTQPSGVNDESSADYAAHYYYKDYPAYGIRLLSLDLNYWDDAQAGWMQSTLSSARSNGYAVICFNHYPMAENGERLASNWTSIEYGNNGSTHINDAPIQLVDDFIGNGGEFVCWLNGHTHYDVVEKAKNSTHLQLSVDVNACSHYLNGDGMATEYTQSQDCFNVLSVDRQDKLLRIIRIGRNQSRYMQERNAICIKYNTATIVAES